MKEQRDKLLDYEISAPLVARLGQKTVVMDDDQSKLGLSSSEREVRVQRPRYSIAQLTFEDQKRAQELDQEERQIFGDTELCLDGNGLCAVEPGAPVKPSSFKKRVHQILESPTWHLIIMAFVIIDAICTSMEIALALGLKEYSKGPNVLLASEIFDRIGGVISHIFVCETLLHLWTGGLTIFTGKMEVCDFAVVWITFLLRQFVTHESACVDHADLVQFILLVRLWRIVSVVDAVALAASSRAKEKFRQERRELEKIIRFWQDRYLQEKEKKLIALKLSLADRDAILAP